MIQHFHQAPEAPARVVVLGASGFIGAAVCGALRREGVPILGLSSRDLDLTAADAGDRLATALRPSDAIVFSAALTREHGRDVATLMRNLTMGESVISALDRSQCAHVVYLSSDAVYGDAAASPVTERTACEPSDLYGVMHLTRERMMADAAGRLGWPLLVIRPCGVYGVTDTHGGYGPNRFRRTIRGEGRIQLIGMGEELRDHIHVDDVATLVVLALSFRSKGLLNAATGSAVRFAELAEMMRRRAGSDVVVEPLPRRQPATDRYFDVGCLSRAFPDFVPRPLETGLESLCS